MEEIELWPESAQKAYKITNIVRKVSMFIAWGLFIILFVVMTVATMKDLFSYGFSVWIESMVGGFFLCMIVPFMIHTFVHSEFLFKNMAKSMGIIGIILALFAVEFRCFVGAYWGIKDLYLFIKKKPLVYEKEYDYFLETREAQQELNREYNEAVMSAIQDEKNRNQTAEDLKKLKEMQEDGLISEEEFNEKKKEILAKF